MATTTKKKPGRKATGRLRKPINLTIPEPTRSAITRASFKSGISVSEWFTNLANRELGITPAA